MEISDVIQGLNFINSAAETLETLFRTFLVVLIIPSLLNCFFGYKIQKFQITLTGVVVGGVIGAIIGAIWNGEYAALILALLAAVIGGFLAFKLYLVGVFFNFWFYGTLLFAVLFIAIGAIGVLPVTLVLGLFVGILALVLHKGFIICITAIYGGMPAGVFLGGMVGDFQLIGLLLGVVLSALGIFVQFSMEKKRKGTGSTRNAGIVSAPTIAPTPVAAAAAAPAIAAAPTVVPAPGLAVQQPASPAVAENRIQLLGTAVPTTYCPRSGVLVEECSLFKDGNENVLASISFRNVGSKPVVAVYYTLLCRSIGGDELGSVERILLDLNVAPGAKFSSGEPFQLTDYTTRRIDVCLTQVVTVGGESIRLTEEDNKPLPQPSELRSSLSAELLELAGVGADERYFLTELENGLWECTCGTIAGESCPNCGRTRNGVLRDNGSDIYVRINDRIKTELNHLEGIAAKRELSEARSAISRDRELLQNCENLKELCGDCDRALESIEERLSKIALREEKTKKKVFRYGLFAGAAAGCIAVLVLAIIFVRGLPPSDNRIRKDIIADLAERYENYQITRIEIEDLSSKSDRDWKEYEVELWGEDEKFHDELYASTYISYEKEHGVFNLHTISSYIPVITPDEKPSPSDTYIDLEVDIKVNDSLITVSDYGEGWDLLSEWVNISDLTYNSRMDYAGVEMNESIARIPVSFLVSYQNAEGELDSTVDYTYLGNRVWQAGSVNPCVVLHPRDDIILTHESLNGILKSETMLYEGSTLSCEYLTLSGENVSYSDGYRHATVNSGFAWNDGQGGFDGRLVMELDYTSSRWLVTSVSYPEVSHSTPNNAITGDGAMELLRAAIERDASISGEVVELTIDSVNESQGFADLTAYCVAREGEYLRTIMVSGNYEYHAGQGYQANGNLQYSSGNLRPEQDISTSVTTRYTLSTSGTTPVGIASSGSAQATVSIDTYGKANFALNIDGLRVNLTGGMDQQLPVFSCSSAPQDILVHYTLIFSLDSKISYSASGSLRYENGMLSGAITFSTVALGLDDFSVTLWN